MGRYVRRRLIQMVPLLFGISLLIFLIIQAAPGGPEAIFLENRLFIDPSVIDAFRQRLGLDQPVPVQYVRWVTAVLSGDFGISFTTGRPVGDMIAERLPATLELMSVSFVFAAVVALPLGVYSAGQRFARAHRAQPARREERAHPGCLDHGARPGGSLLRRRHHGDDLRLAGRRAALRAGHVLAGLPAPHGHSDDGLVPRCVLQPPRGYRLRLA